MIAYIHMHPFTTVNFSLWKTDHMKLCSIVFQVSKTCSKKYLYSTNKLYYNVCPHQFTCIALIVCVCAFVSVHVFVYMHSWISQPQVFVLSTFYIYNLVYMFLMRVCMFVRACVRACGRACVFVYACVCVNMCK